MYDILTPTKMKIKKLPKDIVLKIAAGEVIERPASVVKELIENSIDANAKTITVEIINGGKDLIKVSDDGVGIEKDELKLAIERHATSKISDEDDLNKIVTLGFRGEALASIASVSRLTIISKTKNSFLGGKLEVDEKGVKIRDISANQGTTVIVKDLFYNTPARRKFLKSINIERKHIYNIVLRYALANPHIKFKLVDDGNISIDKPSTKTLYESATYLFSKEIYKNLVPFSYEGKIKAYGLLGKPTIARKDNDYMFFFVNNRYIKNDTINKAVIDAYNTTLFLDRKPVIVVKIEIDPEKVNVNIHPQKLEVKFDDEPLIYNEIFEAVRKAILSNNLIENKTEKTQQIHFYDFVKDNKKLELKEKSNNKFKYGMRDSDQTYLKEPKSEISIERIRDKIRILGQIHKTYLIGESSKGLIIIDQHAAAERINFEKLNRELIQGEVKKQKLINPVIIRFDGLDFEIIKENIEKIKKFGFEIEVFGNREIIVRAIPSIYHFYDEKDIKSLLLDIAKEFRVKSNEQLVNERIIFTMACRRSLKAGKEVTINEAYELLRQLFQCEKPYTCPHGRPTIIELEIDEIEKMFKRSL